MAEKDDNAENNPKVQMVQAMTKNLADKIKVERFPEPRTVQATVAVTFRGHTVYCSDDRGAEFVELAAKALAMHMSVVLVNMLSTPEGIAELMDDKKD